MAGPRIASKDDLKAYILRQLGGEAVNIEMTALNLDDCIADSIDEYLPVAFSGVIERFIPITLLKGYNDYILPYDVYAVTMIHSVGMLGLGTTSPANLFSMNQFIAADLYKPGTAKIDLLGFELVNEAIQTMDIMFSKKISFDFNCISKILHLFASEEDQTVMLQVYKKLDLSGTAVSGGRYAEENIYNEKWVRNMCVAKSQKQWAQNLLKYGGTVLPNGGVLNAEFLYNEAKERVKELMEDLQNNYVLPTDFFIA
jgi:hypothetical protein